MGDLRAQARGEPLDRLGRPGRDREGQRTPPGILDLRRKRVDDCADVPRVPLHRAVGGRVLEALEREGDEPGRLAERTQDRGREVTRVDQRLALDERHETHQVGHALALDGDDLAPVEGCAGSRDLQRQTLAEVHHGAVLEVELGLAEGRVCDLEHEAAGRPVDQRVLVLMRAELAHGPIDAEALARDLARLLEPEAGRVQLMAGEAHAHAGYGIASCSSRPWSSASSMPLRHAARPSSRSPASSWRSTP